MVDLPLVSIILTSYNQGQYIKQCIESILEQSYTNFELIISDDCSTDNSLEIINSFRDERIHLNVSENNKGTTMLNLESCIHMGNGKYIAVAHSDDLWDKHKLEKQLFLLENRPEFGAVFTLAERIDTDNIIIENDNSLFVDFNGTQAEWLNCFFYKYNILCHPSVMIHRDIYQSIMKKFTGAVSYRQLGDFLIWIELVKQKQIYVLPEKLMRFRIHENSMSSVLSVRNLRCFKNELYFILKNFFEDIPENLFIDGFCGNFIKKGKLTKEELLCEQAFLYLIESDIHTRFIYYQIGMEKLYHLLNSEQSRKTLEESYNFTAKDFHALKEDVPPIKDYEYFDYCYERVIGNKKLENSKSTAIYGSGKYAYEIFNYISNNDKYNSIKIKCFIENNNNKTGETLCGLPIVLLEKAMEIFHVDTIIIGSYSYQNVIYDRIMNQANGNINLIKMF